MSTHPDHDDYDEPTWPEEGAVDELRADADTRDRTRAERSGRFTEDDDG
ncbi:hypothetical protein [Streptomonospora wellingtoniae]|uniref:Uncharacterized protein n=1 Tax=Streptomonospora wellingtoniae TaxID=3075544 RepID=A0ABU2KUG7_9ACTN|nr:hypothetical protein [Streptomonospora sp. DSM 45055]MDT0302939.1 hypothetical protein [Streptomonospora sp. DSM 45055]